MYHSASRSCSLAGVASRGCITKDVQLVGTVDPEERFARFPSHYTMKGMFFSRLVAIGGEPVMDAVGPLLKKRPALGRYLPFSDYPQVDYSRLAHAVAIRREPEVDAVEAMRRLARDDVRTFADSAIGSVMLALVSGDVTDALLRLPDMYRASLKGGEVTSHLDARDRVTLDYRSFHGWLECYPVGHVEGLCAHFGRSSETEIEFHDTTRATYRVRVVT